MCERLFRALSLSSYFVFVVTPKYLIFDFGLRETIEEAWTTACFYDVFACTIIYIIIVIGTLLYFNIWIYLHFFFYWSGNSVFEACTGVKFGMDHRRGDLWRRQLARVPDKTPGSAPSTPDEQCELGMGWARQLPAREGKKRSLYSYFQ